MNLLFRVCGLIIVIVDFVTHVIAPRDHWASGILTMLSLLTLMALLSAIRLGQLLELAEKSMDKGE